MSFETARLSAVAGPARAGARGRRAGVADARRLSGGQGAHRARHRVSPCAFSSQPACSNCAAGRQAHDVQRRFVVDDFARFMKMLVLIGSVATLVLSTGIPGRTQSRRTSNIRFWSCSRPLGMMMMISANDLIALYLGLELQSLALYVVAAINRDNARSTEAGLKYFVLGALSSGMLLYGASLVYGFTGHRSFAGIAGTGGAETGSSASSSAWSSCSPASPSRFRPCRSTCGRPTSMRARRPR